MRKPATGEPYAGEPHVRFGGRGGLKPSLPLSCFVLVYVDRASMRPVAIPGVVRAGLERIAVDPSP